MLNVSQLDKPINERELWTKPIVPFYPPKRRNHVAALVRDHMVIHGGINEDQETIESMWVFDLKENEWEEATLLDKIEP